MDEHYLKVHARDLVAQCAGYPNRGYYYNRLTMLDPHKLPEFQEMAHSLWGAWLANREKLHEVG